jgi:diguanylate cyclase (GGDEF)-like protein
MIANSTMSGQAASSRWGTEPVLDAMLRFGTRTRPLQAWAAVASGIGLVALLDSATGSRMWFGPVYLLIICGASWLLGWRSGVATGIVCAGLTKWLNGPGLYPLGGAILVWDVAMRFLAVTIIVALIGSVRRSHDREWRRARSDALTGLLNRRGFFDTLAAAPRRGWNLLVYLDLDGLKRINDRYGHAAGDTVLQDFAKGMREIIRSTDIFARIGGDEFLLLLSVSDETEGRETALRLHERINALQSKRVCASLCSMGVLIRGPEAGAVGERDVALADELMYQAKTDGSGIRIAKPDCVPTTRPEPADSRRAPGPTALAA